MLTYSKAHKKLPENTVSSIGAGGTVGLASPRTIPCDTNVLNHTMKVGNIVLEESIIPFGINFK